LQAIRTTCKNLKEAAKIKLVIDNGAVDTIFITDETLITRALVNLTKNALEASSPGQTVTLGCDAHGQSISLWCHNGGYIPRPIQLQIFHRSFSTKDKGRGLGTYSVKLLTERYLHGTVTFVSTEKSGTTFTITVPVKR
jgi:signal transduction histidine kinase